MFFRLESLRKFRLQSCDMFFCHSRHTHLSSIDFPDTKRQENVSLVITKDTHDAIEGVFPLVEPAGCTDLENAGLLYASAALARGLIHVEFKKHHLKTVPIFGIDTQIGLVIFGRTKCASPEENIDFGVVGKREL